MIGGFFYTEDKDLYNALLNEFSNSKELSVEHQNNLYKQFLLEKKWFHPRNYRIYKYYNFAKRVKKKLLGKPKIALFMDGDNGPPDKIKPLILILQSCLLF